MPILQTTDLHKSFPSPQGSVQAVRGVSLTVEEGEVLAFVGPNGAGKTTTIKMIAGLIRTDRGSVRVCGHDPQNDPRALLDIGAVLEGNRNLYWRLTPSENLEYFAALKRLPAREARLRARDLLSRFDLKHKATTPVRQLSRGMQQKTALAVALIHRPRLLLLDEPTLGLDVEAAEVVKDLIRESASEGRAILLTTHQMGVAEELSQRLAIIRDGVVIVEDATRSVLDQFSGEAYHLEVEAPLDADRRRRLESLGAMVEGDHKIEYLGSPDDLYTVIESLRPLPIVRIEKDRADLTAVFLKLVRETVAGPAN